MDFPNLALLERYGYFIKLRDPHPSSSPLEENVRRRIDRLRLTLASRKQYWAGREAGVTNRGLTHASGILDRLRYTPCTPDMCIPPPETIERIIRETKRALLPGQRKEFAEEIRELREDLVDLLREYGVSEMEKRIKKPLTETQKDKFLKNLDVFIEQEFKDSQF
jgi:hypothetical protein